MAVHSDSLSVVQALRGVLGQIGDQKGAFLVSRPHLDQLRDLVSSLSWIESRTLKACVLDERGDFDPWDASPVTQVLDRLGTPWFQQVMAEQTICYNFQPIAHAITGEIFANEALMRATHASEPITPNRLIDAAKAHDSLVNLDQLCRKLAIEQSVDYLCGGGRVFINFFPITVYDPDVCLGMTFGAAQRVGVDPARLWFEVVESEEFPDLQHLRRIVDYIRGHGAKVVLDDIGSGNTAILYIDQLEPDVIKIDREVLNRAVETGETSIFIGLIRYAQEREIITIAEGVETMKELDFCRELGVNYVQGYLISRPKAEPMTGVIHEDHDEQTNAEVA
ncbi:EAL domain-containing protein [Mucisphaera calidilacus]|nr:EAL domain-containing protein [Mucisphaera calidilacus]